MRVISRRRLREFWEVHPRAAVSLQTWYKVVNVASWRDFAELRQTYPSADQVGRLVVFNTAGNRYRLVDYEWQRVFVRAVMTHEEYDLGFRRSEVQVLSPRLGSPEKNGPFGTSRTGRFGANCPYARHCGLRRRAPPIPGWGCSWSGPPDRNSVRQRECAAAVDATPGSSMAGCAWRRSLSGSISRPYRSPWRRTANR